MVGGTKPGVSSAHHRASAVLGVLLVGCGPSSVAGDGDSSSGSTAHADGTTSSGTTSGGTTTSSGAEWPADVSSSADGESSESSTTGYVGHCEVPPGTPAACWDAICDNFLCGPAGSLYDGEGCPRSECERASDCTTPSFCGANILANPCPGGSYGWWSCEDFDGECLCGGSLGCSANPRGYCLDPKDVVEQELCLASAWPCDMLPGLVDQTHGALVEIAADMSAELLDQARTCQWLRMERLFDECEMLPCQLLCAVSAGCQAMDCAAVCDAADPAEVLDVLQALVDRSQACADCALCDELDNALCSTLAGC